MRTVWRRLARLWHRWLRAVDRASREDWTGADGRYVGLDEEPVELTEAA